MYFILLVVACFMYARYRVNRQRTKELQDELDTRNRFFSIISHDLRAPVTGIRNLSMMLEEHFDDLSPEELKEKLSMLRIAAEGTSIMLENLLMWSISHKGVLCPVIREESFSDLAKESIGTLNNIETDIPSGLTIRTDRHMMVTCIRNLLDNAVKFSPKDKPVVLKADGEKIVVTDKGPGMSPEILAEMSSKGHLGLVITRELLEKLGASLSARNLQEGGCEVTIHYLTSND
ncbi:MAG: HAMP domain-containing histidine kinase [Bacteroidales bacterium]|nr:HAMP domain-containing histidine kinase [Bacteroidales bacterium]